MTPGPTWRTRAERRRDARLERPNPHIPYERPPQVYHRVVAELAARHTPSGRVLDIGCGMGDGLDALHRLNPELELHGADTDPVCVTATAERVPGATAVRIPAGDNLDLRGIDGRFDTCILSHVLEHVLYPADALRQAIDRLVEGGHLVLAAPNLACPKIVVLAALRRDYVNRGHAHGWDRSHWINFLERRCGLDVVEYAADEVRVLPAAWTRRLKLLQRAEIALGRALPGWAYSNIAAVRRPS